MTIQLQFLNLVLPISMIAQKYPGGWERYKRDYGLSDPSASVTDRPTYDEHLFKDSAMSPHDMEQLVRDWEKLGFVGIVEENGEQIWKEMCVVDELFGPTLRCDWIKYDRKTRTVSLVK
jgi:hypothetical protein